MQEEVGYKETQTPVELNSVIDNVVAGEDGLYDITYFTATGTLSDPYHNLNIEGAKTALAFYGNDSDIWDLDRYCDTKAPITVTGYYISKQSTRINFIVTDIEPKLPEEE